MRNTLTGTLLALVTVALLASPPARAQARLPVIVDSGTVSSVSGEVSRESFPFMPGEKLLYKVRVGYLGSVGEGRMEVRAGGRIRGVDTYNLQLHVQGSAAAGLLKVNTLMQSWFSPDAGHALRFDKNQHEIRYKSHKIYDFFPAEGVWRRADEGATHVSGPLPTTLPLDDVSFLYYVRALPLEPGETYTLRRYFEADGNPVVVKVLRRETVEVAAGRFETVVVQPTIQTDGLFGDGGEAELYFTDDERRLLVKMSSRMPVLKSLELELKEIESLGSASTAGR